MMKEKYKIFICNFSECKFPPNIKLRKDLRNEIINNNLTDKVEIIETGCTGHCAPFIIIEFPSGERFIHNILNEECLKEVIKRLIV